MQNDTLQLKSKTRTKTAAWKWIWALLAALFVVMLAVIFARSWQRLRAMPEANPSSARLKLPTAEAATSSAPLDVKADASVEDGSRPATETQERKAINAESRRPVSTFTGIDESAVGQAFQISDSVKKGCRHDTFECPIVMDAIARMVKEPRDIDWATQMEAKIQAAVDRQSQGSGKYVIRNLECRTSICVLEVEEHVPEIFDPYDRIIKSSLRINAMVFAGAEYDPSGARFIISLIDFERR